MNTNNLVHVGGRMKFCPSEIVLLESDSNYTLLHFVDGSKIITSTNLGKLEARFASHNFFRPNKSYIINLDYITEYLMDSCHIIMENNEAIKLSRRKVKPFLASQSGN